MNRGNLFATLDWCAHARKFLPQLSDFFPTLGMIFAPLWAYFFNFSLYIVRMAKSSGGELPPLRSSVRETCQYHQFWPLGIFGKFLIKSLKTILRSLQGTLKMLEKSQNLVICCKSVGKKFSQTSVVKCLVGRFIDALQV